MDKLVLLITLPNGLQKSTYDPNGSSSCVCYYYTPCSRAVGGALPPAIAQEETSLGEEEDIAGSIVSNVLGGSDNNNDADEGSDSNTSDEIDQETTNTGTTNPNQDQTLDQYEKEV